MDTNVAQELETRAQALFAEANRCRLEADRAVKQAEILSAASRSMAAIEMMQTELAPTPQRSVTYDAADQEPVDAEQIDRPRLRLTHANYDEVLGPIIYNGPAARTQAIREVPIRDIIRMGRISFDLFDAMVTDHAEVDETQLKNMWQATHTYLRNRLGWTITDGVQNRGRMARYATYEAPSALPMPRNNYTPTERALFADLNLI
jgi:hypothetical protein